MELEDIKRFIDDNNRELTIFSLKSDGLNSRNEYEFHSCCYIKELPGIVFELDSWDEEQIIEKAKNMYESIQDHIYNQYKLELPDINKVKFYIQTTFSEQEWLKN